MAHAVGVSATKADKLRRRLTKFDAVGLSVPSVTKSDKLWQTPTQSECLAMSEKVRQTNAVGLSVPMSGNVRLCQTKSNAVGVRDNVKQTDAVGLRDKV